MRFLYWIYALAAFGLCLFLFVHVRRAESADPRVLLEHARSAMSGPDLDLIQAGHDLEAALAAAERAADRPLIEEVLLQRAKLARQTNALARAKADLEDVLAHHRPNSPAIESMLAGVMLDAGDVELALARADSVLARDRNQPEAWGVRAEALLTLADRRIEECVRLAGIHVAGAGLASTEQLMRRIAARPPADTTRLRLTQELYERFEIPDKELAREVQSRLDDASNLLSMAPEALAQSFRAGVRPKALTEYVRTLHEAGESEAAADLGLVALSLPGYVTYAPLLRLLLGILEENGRAAAIPELIDPKLVRRVALDSQFFRDWARTLIRLENWPLLQVAGHQLRASDVPETRLFGEWCIAISMARQKRWAEAVPMLRRRLAAPGAEPFEHAHAWGWLAIAESSRAQGAAPEEAAALARALAAASPKLSGVGEIHLRLAELELLKPQPNRGLALESLTQALRFLPERRAELEPRWRELGALLLRVRNLDLQRACADLERENRLAPEEKRTSFEFVGMAELQFEQGRLASALALGMRALEQHPGLAPALRVACDAAVGLDAWEQATRLLRERIELEGPRPELVRALVAAPPELMGPERGRELVRLDPSGVGRRWAAEDLRRLGRPQEAIDGLARIAPERRSDGDHILLAELHFELGQYARAQVELSQLGADTKLLASAAPLMLSIAARQRNSAHAERILRLLDFKVELDLASFVEALDELLLHGLVDVVAKACDKLDSRQRWRSPQAHLRLAQAALLNADFADARESLERALAYDSSGSSDLGRLILAVEERRWGDCRALHAEVLASGFQPTGLQFVALAALGEKFDDARIVLESEIAQRRAEEGANPNSPLTPLESLLTSALDALARPHEPTLDPLTREHGFGMLPASAVQRDPRPLLARLAALDDPNWTAWAVADLARQTPPAKGSLWPVYLAARGAAWLTVAVEAERLARSLVEHWPQFAPGWDVAADAVAAQAGPDSEARLLELLDGRRKALSAAAMVPVDAALLDARLARLRGQWDDAARNIEAAFVADPKRSDVLIERARIARQRKQRALAVESLHLALASPKRADPALVREFCETLEEARQALGAPYEGVVKREFDFLLERYGDDPWVRLERTRLAYPLGSGVDPWVAEHALRELESARAQLQDGLEAVQPGVTLRWAQFYARLDPARALALVDAELNHAPQSAALWTARGAYAAELGRLAEATSALEVALELAPEPQAGRALVELAARQGVGEDALRAQIEQVSQLVGLPVDDPSFRLALARSMVRAQRSKASQGVALLAELWSGPSAPPKASDAWREIGQLYGIALCRRAAAADGALALDVFTQIAPTIGDPLEASVVATLRSLAAALRARG